MKPSAWPPQLLDQASLRLRRRRDLTVKPHLAAASRFRERHRRALLVNVQPHECTMVHLTRLLWMRLGNRPSCATLDRCILETGASAQARNIRSMGCFSYSNRLHEPFPCTRTKHRRFHDAEQTCIPDRIVRENIKGIARLSDIIENVSFLSTQDDHWECCSHFIKVRKDCLWPLAMALNIDNS